MSHDENSSIASQEFSDAEDSIAGLSTSFGSDGSQAEEVASQEEPSRDSSPSRGATPRRQRNAGGSSGRARSANRGSGGRAVAAAERTRPAPRARTTTRGAGRGRSRRPVKGASKFCGRCGRSLSDKDQHSHKGCGRTYFYKFDV